MGVPAGAELIALAEAAVRGEAVDDVRAAVVEAVGADGAGLAVATIAAFSGLVRVADGIGIPVDDGLAGTSASIRRDLGLDAFGGAANIDVDAADALDGFDFAKRS
ncbi:MAG: hypothetical protein AAGA42_10480 [Actinomycetota bacterium]